MHVKMRLFLFCRVLCTEVVDIKSFLVFFAVSVHQRLTNNAGKAGISSEHKPYNLCSSVSLLPILGRVILRCIQIVFI